MPGIPLEPPPDARQRRAECGGESGIRTRGTVSRTHAFQACALNHSAISPFERVQQFTGGLGATQLLTAATRAIPLARAVLSRRCCDALPPSFMVFFRVHEGSPPICRGESPQSGANHSNGPDAQSLRRTS